MFGGISFGGLGSGLDTGAIINALVNVERIPIQMLEARKETANDKIELVGALEGHVKDLREKASALATMSSFLSFEASNSNEALIEVSAGSTAEAGSHSIVVQQVLATDRWAFNGVLDTTTDLATSAGTSVSFDYEGTNYAFNFAAAAGTSLDAIAASINAGPNGGVTAQVMQTGTASSPNGYQLVLTAADGGASRQISGITSTVEGLSIDSTPGGANNITVGADAQAVIDGLQFQRESNDFSDVLTGVSLQVLAADVGETVTFTVGPDKEAIKTQIGEFKDAYNTVVKFLNDQSTYGEESGAGGLLFGDNMLRTVERSLRNTLFGQITSASTPGAFDTLGIIGISVDKTGTMSVDDTVLDAKLDEDLNAVAELFADSDGFDNGGLSVGDPNYYVDTTLDSGLADDLMRELDRLTKGFADSSGSSLKGIFDARKAALEDSVSRIDDDIEHKEYRLSRFEENLVARFSALEGLMASLNAQSSFLNSGILASIPAPQQ